MNRLPSYLRQALEHMKHARPGEVIHVEIRHDDWCPIFEGGPCNCDPDVESGARVERKYDGQPEPRRPGA